MAPAAPAPAPASNGDFDDSLFTLITEIYPQHLTTSGAAFDPLGHVISAYNGFLLVSSPSSNTIYSYDLKSLTASPLQSPPPPIASTAAPTAASTTDVAAAAAIDGAVTPSSSFSTLSADDILINAPAPLLSHVTQPLTPVTVSVMPVPPSLPQPTVTVITPEDTRTTLFGSAMSVYGDRAIIGARGDAENGYLAGAALIYQKQTVTKPSG
jgi:hypothetical protein